MNLWRRTPLLVRNFREFGVNLYRRMLRRCDRGKLACPQEKSLLGRSMGFFSVVFTIYSSSFVSSLTYEKTRIQTNKKAGTRYFNFVFFSQENEQIEENSCVLGLFNELSLHISRMGVVWCCLEGSTDRNPHLYTAVYSSTILRGTRVNGTK